MNVWGWVSWLTGREAGVVEQVESRLRARPHLALKGVSCGWREGVLTLRGRVATPSLRGIAEALARRIKAVDLVENEIEVVVPTPREALERRLTGVRVLGPRHEQQF